MTAITRRAALAATTAAVAVAATTASAPLGGVDDPVLVLKREWDARWDRWANETSEDEEVTDPLFEALSETEYEIFQTPATSIEGVAFKLVLWTRQHIPQGYTGDGDWGSSDEWSRLPVTAFLHDLDKLPVVSALNDLERMTRGARPT